VLDGTIDPQAIDPPPVKQGTRTLMYLNYNNQPVPLNIRILDVAPPFDAVPQAATPSRLRKVIEASKANIVRLVPGTTRIPVGPEFDVTPSPAR
jgi:hypothetical protein